MPPNIAYFLDHGLRESGRWFVPLLLQLPAGITEDDVRAVLTALANQHDALRLQIVERAGAWEEHIAPPGEFTALATRSLPAEAARGGPLERDAILTLLTEFVADRDPLATPLAAVVITGDGGGPVRLALAIHHLVNDAASRQIVLADLGTAVGQRLAGAGAVALSPPTMTWREWSQRCAALATNPAIVDSRAAWLDTCASPTLRVVDHESAERPCAGDLARFAAPLSDLLTAELDGASQALGLATHELLVAALGRTIARTLGEGVVAVDLAGDGRLVLEPYVDLHRTVGWFSTIYPVPLTCVNDRKADATQMLAGVHRALGAVAHQGIARGLLQYVYAPTAFQFAARPPSDVFFSYHPDTPGPSGPVQFDGDPAMTIRDTVAGLGHAIELRAYRNDGVLQLDWWYDTRRIEPYTIEELSEQFPLALIELTSEAVPPIEDATHIALPGTSMAVGAVAG